MYVEIFATYKQRAKLDGRTDLTPVSEETYPEWLENFAREQLAAKEAKTKKKLQKKGKKGLSGRELFMVDESAFVDDAAAENEYVFEKAEAKSDNENDNQNKDTKNNSNNEENKNKEKNSNDESETNTNGNKSNDTTTNDDDVDETVNIDDIDASLFLMDDMGLDDPIDQTDKTAPMEDAD